MAKNAFFQPAKFNGQSAKSLENIDVGDIVISIFHNLKLIT